MDESSNSRHRMKLFLIGFLILVSIGAVSAGLFAFIKHAFFGPDDYVSKSPETIERDLDSKTLPFANNSLHLDSPPKIGQWLHLRAHFNQNSLQFCLLFISNTTFNPVTICSNNTIENGKADPRFTFESRFNNGTVIRDRATNGLYTGLAFDVRVRILEQHLQVFVNRGEIGIFDKPDTFDKINNISLSGELATVTVFRLKGSRYEMPFKRDMAFRFGDRLDISAHPIANVRDLSAIKALLGTAERMAPVVDNAKKNETNPLDALKNHNYNFTEWLNDEFNATTMEFISDSNKTQTLIDKLLHLSEHIRTKRRSSGSSSRGHSSSGHSGGHSSGGGHSWSHSGSGWHSGSSGHNSGGWSSPSWHSSGGHSSWHSSPPPAPTWVSHGGQAIHPSYPTRDFYPVFHHPATPSTSTYILPGYYGNNRGQSAARWASPMSGMGSTATGAGVGFAGGYTTGYMANSFVPSYSYHYMGHTYYHSSCYDCGYYSCYSCGSHYYRSRSRSTSSVESLTQSIPQSERIDITFLHSDGSWAFALSFRFSEGRFVRNTYQNGAWEEEESGSLPIDNWRIFDLTLMNSEDDIAIYFAGKRVATFKHREASKTLEKIMIEKDVEIFNIAKNGQLIE